MTMDNDELEYYRAHQDELRLEAMSERVTALDALETEAAGLDELALRQAMQNLYNTSRADS